MPTDWHNPRRGPMCCRRCDEETMPDRPRRFIVCQTCGNKRCPHATDHRLSCTYSNRSGQPGSAYHRSSKYEHQMVDVVWITQWVQWPTTHTTGGSRWALTRCVVRDGRVVAMYEI